MPLARVQGSQDKPESPAGLGDPGNPRLASRRSDAGFCFGKLQPDGPNPLLLGALTIGPGDVEGAEKTHCEQNMNLVLSDS